MAHSSLSATAEARGALLAEGRHTLGIVGAATGQEGLGQATAQAFDCVILDLLLPGRGGLEVLADLRQMGNNVPVLILNGEADAANLKVAALLKAIPTARTSVCEGDHHSAPYQPGFQQAVATFLKEQWQQRGWS